MFWRAILVDYGGLVSKPALPGELSSAALYIKYSIKPSVLAFQVPVSATDRVRHHRTEQSLLRVELQPSISNLAREFNSAACQADRG